MEINDDLKYSLRRHDDLEAEIKQHIHGSTQNVQIALFEYLKGLYKLITNETKEVIEKRVLDYNDKMNENFKNEINIRVAEFHKSDEYLTREHKEKYEVITKNWGLIVGWAQTPKIVKKTHYKWYVINDKAPVIDWKYMPEYFKLFDEIIGNITRILKYYIALYDVGKIYSNASLILPLSLSANQTPPPATEQPGKEDAKKLKIKLSVAQLACLFRLFSETHTLLEIEDGELFNFIAANFITQQTYKTGISTNTIRNDFYTCDQKTLDFWGRKFIEMNKAGRSID